MSEKVAFTISLPPQKIHTPVASDASPSTTRRVIYLKGVGPIVHDQGKSNKIVLEKVYDDRPAAGDPFDSLCTFVIAIGREKDAAKPSGLFDALLSKTDSTELPVFPSAKIKLDEKNQGAYVWAGAGGLVVTGASSSITFSDASEIVSHLAPGENLYLRITVRSKDHSDPSFIGDVESSPGMALLSPAKLGVVSPTGGALGRNIIPKSEAHQNLTEWRRVAIGRRPLQVTGRVGIFLKRWGLLPGVAQHWSICVGDYYHELVTIDDKNTIIYQNGKVEDETYELQDIGYTTFNDQALVESGRKSIQKMDMVYRMRDNNCQKFAIHLLNLVCLVGRERVVTSFGFAQETMGPEIKYSEETGEFEIEEVEMAPPKEEEPEVTICRDLFYVEEYVALAGSTTDIPYTLSEEEKTKVLDRALALMGGEFDD
ncbi:hypothetical protein M413DRAFT_32516 [Hebeloma cylindrosporum]|uniref:PPPDE domain-containing protein n=1 Tax=Hebeloma cylindrosporum TaxID=76867 RepID=A0A0C2XBR9_HEBCY|nr:hypothetical protein M413DRAFT_32516 [Hebeloma cylindrosporum h7]